MTNCGIKLVWGNGWCEPQGTCKHVGFSDRACKRWKDDLPVGTQMLLYLTGMYGGPKAIVAGLKVTGTFEDGTGITPSTTIHTNMLPVTIVLARAEATPVPLARVREIIGRNPWPLPGISWQPVSEDQYRALLAELRGEGEAK